MLSAFFGLRPLGHLLTSMPSLGVVRENQWTVAPNIYSCSLENNFSCFSPISTLMDFGKLANGVKNKSKLHRKKEKCNLML